VENTPDNVPLDNRGNPLRIGDIVVFKRALHYGAPMSVLDSGSRALAVKPLGRFVITKFNYNSDYHNPAVIVTSLSESTAVFAVNPRALALSAATEIARLSEETEE